MNALPRLIYVALLPLFAISLWATPALADEHEQGSASFGLRPVRYDPNRPETESYFVYDAVPGQVIHDEMLLINQGTEAGTARLYPVDATTGQTSGTVFLSQADPRTRAGAWLDITEAEVTLQPGEQRVIPFTVTIPQDARDGQHVAGLVAEDVALRSGAQEGALQVKIQNRTVVAVQVNLPGPAVEAITITSITSDVQQGYQMLLLGLRNDGNQMLKPGGELVISGVDGQEIQRIPLQLETFLPDTAIDYPVVVPGQALAAGTYTVSVDFRYGGEGAASFQQEVAISAEQAEQVTGSIPQLPPATTTRTNDSLLRWILPSAIAAALIAGVAAFVVIRSRSRLQRGTSVVDPAGSSAPLAASEPARRRSIEQIKPPSQTRTDD